MLWQSVPGLVSVKGISANGGADRYINFSVDRTKIQEASAIIGLQNGNTVYWSWHIWITSPEVASVDKGCFMREPIGFRHTKWMKTTYDKDREVKVYFKQRRSGAQATLILTQKPHEEVEGIALYYQQGRKDPLYVGGAVLVCKSKEINSGMMLIHAAQLPLKMARPRMLTYHQVQKATGTGVLNKEKITPTSIFGMPKTMWVMVTPVGLLKPCTTHVLQDSEYHVRAISRKLRAEITASRP